MPTFESALEELEHFMPFSCPFGLPTIPWGPPAVPLLVRGAKNIDSMAPSGRGYDAQTPLLQRFQKHEWVKAVPKWLEGVGDE